MERAAFTRIDESTRADWEIISRFEARELVAPLADRILALVNALDGAEDAQPFPVTRLEHSLQTASRAYRDDADDELIVAALVHDVGDELAPHNHAEFAASLLKPYVSAKTHWIVAQHDVFQGKYYWDKVDMDPNARDKFKSHEWFDACEAFCRDWDCPSFDPNYDSLPLEFFEPLVRRIFARAPYSMR